MKEEEKEVEEQVILEEEEVKGECIAWASCETI